MSACSILTQLELYEPDGSAAMFCTGMDFMSVFGISQVAGDCCLADVDETHVDWLYTVTYSIFIRQNVIL